MVNVRKAKMVSLDSFSKIPHLVLSALFHYFFHLGGGVVDEESL